MTLTAGSRLGPYEILSPLGAGGMGEVYRARDTRLERTVAIKVLPSHLSQDAERRQRFEREAKTISQLSHPHICALYDVGHQNGTDYLIMEYLEGETLAQRLTKGRLPTEQVLRYGIQIADALDKAHRQGIVHRDLKPGNVMLTRSGVKLLDFGLAKAMAPMTPQSGFTLTPQSGFTSVPTVPGAPSLTQEGTIQGTFQYMAPEQLEGKEADARTDIFAFGSVLYEMATGQKAFTGESQASLIAAIFSSDPRPVSALEPMAPPALDRGVKRCLAKDPDDRWQSARDLMLELQWIAAGGSQVALSAPVLARRKGRERFAWGLVAIIAALFLSLAFLAARFRSAASQAAPVRSFLLAPEKTTFQSLGPGGPVAVSPDGRRLTFAATTSDGKSLLYVRGLEAVAAQALAGTDGASFPFWSPDSRFIGFFADAKLKRIDVTGGPALTLCDSPDGRGGTWSRQGVILFGGRQSPLLRVPAEGGSPREVTKLDAARGDTSHRWPHFLPDGERFLYLACPIGSVHEKNAVFVASLDGKENRLLLAASSNVAHAAGHLLFVRGGALLAQRFNPRDRQLQGDPFPLVEGVQHDTVFSRAVFSVSEEGVMAYQTGSAQAGTRLLWCDRSGKPLGYVGEALPHFAPRHSPDGRRIAVTIPDPRTGNMDVWIYEASRGAKTRLTFDPAHERLPVWSPDGARLAFSSDRKGSPDLYQKSSDGMGEEALLLELPGDQFPTSWSSDGRHLAFNRRMLPRRLDVWILPLFGDRKPFPFLNTEFTEYAAQFSPDGKWVAYVSDESGREEVYVTRFPGPAGKWQVSTAGGEFPRWRGDGKELFYVEAARGLMAAEVHAGTGFESGEPKALFPLRQVVGSQYDVSADGERFLINAREGEQASPPITLVTNWTADLKRK